MARKAFVSVNKLEAGMRVAEHVMDSKGRKLINRGTILDNYIILSMRSRGLDGAFVGDDDFLEYRKNKKVVVPAHIKKIVNENMIQDKKKMALNSTIKSHVENGIKKLFDDTSSKEFSDTTRRIADDLMDAITNNDALAFDIDALKVSDEYTFKHSVDVASIAMVMAKNKGYTDSRIDDIGIAGLLHDLGKTKIPNEILLKPGKLTDSEFEEMKNHSLYGFQLLENKKDISDSVKLAVLQHHEKTNGSGYPHRACGSRISEYAKILTVADIFDALVTDRPYKKAFAKNEAVEILMSMTDEIDFESLNCFLRSVILYPVNSIVNLSNGEKAVVIKNTYTCILRPTVVGIKSGNIYDLANDLDCAGIIITK